MKRSELIKIRELIERASASLADDDALSAPELSPHYEIGKSYKKDDRFLWPVNGKLYKVLQPHTSQADWTPDTAVSLYTEVAASGQGDTPSNPIPYNNNMELVKDKYYSQSGVVYVCFRDTGIPVYNNLADLVGLYVNVWEQE